jgi:hypothetical protein
VELSVNVTTFPEDILVPYQWSVNGTNLLTKFNSSRYQGIQTDTLTIVDVQVEDQGSYACSVANSASGININPTKVVIGKLLLLVGVHVHSVINSRSSGLLLIRHRRLTRESCTQPLLRMRTPE